MTMKNLTIKASPARLFMMLLMSLLLTFLTTQCAPANSSRAVTDANRPMADGDTNKRADSRPEDKKDGSVQDAPIVLLYEMNPWANVIGSDTPSFALYDNGLVIFAHRVESRQFELFSVMLSEQERDSLVASLPAKQFFDLEPRYETTLITDQQTTVIYMRDGSRAKSVSVYGGLRRTDNDRKAGAPPAFIEIYEKIKGFNDTRAERWMPEKIEMMIWPYENAGSALAWPKGWPDTKHPQTKKRGDGMDEIAYSIYLTPKQYETFKSRVARAGENAVLINGREWAFDFRYPFPNEDAWRNYARQGTK
jgi:hypothetical protein